MNEKYFELLITLAKKAAKKDEVPVSAIIVKDEKIIAKAYNTRHNSNKIFNHCEMLVISKASRKLKTWHLNDCDIYVTLKPCSMCEAAIKQSRIRNVYYLLDKPTEKKEFNKTNIEQTNNSMLSTTYGKILKEFFKKKRDKN